MDRDLFKDGVHPQIKDLEKRETQPSPLIPLRHYAIERAVRNSRKIDRKIFINTLNYLHFTGDPAILLMSHQLTGEEFLLKVYPGPCIDDTVSITAMTDASTDLNAFILKDLIIDDGQSVLIIPVEPVRFSDRSIILRLHVQGIISKERQTKRFQCSFVHADVSQGSNQFSGQLEDFTSTALHIRINEDIDTLKSSFDREKSLTLALYNRDKLVYSGDCLFLKQGVEPSSVILKPNQTQHPRFKERKLRNPRLCLVPTPKVSFIHPFSNRKVTFEVTDITNSGFSVLEGDDMGQLVPGMIMHEVLMVFSGGLKLQCSAQVVHALRQKKGINKYGFAIFDMDLVTYNQFFNIYSSAIDKHANVTREVDMDALWEFFFKSGFIYPKKYENLCNYKENFKETYERLYCNSPEIFANFTYQSNGNIYGHVSWIKAYERTWMIHHLAAKPMGKKSVGLHVLNHVMYCFDGFCRLPSTGMDYMIFYFRPDNRFPDYFFGGFCREYNNPKGCSMDCFAYLNCSPLPPSDSLPEGWILDECSPGDMASLRAWYEKRSGGLMIDALSLDNREAGQDNISALYERYGLTRRYQVFSLKQQGIAKAFLVADESDMGVNLSEFLNSLKIIVTCDDLPWNILYASLGTFMETYGRQMIPLLVYPHTYMEEHGIAYNHRYNLWALSAQAGDDYTESLKRMAKFRPWKLLMHLLRTTLRRK